MNLPNVIGLAGQAGAGKDTAAAWFIERGYAKSSFSEPMKRMLNQAFGWSMSDWENRQWKENCRFAAWDSEVGVPVNVTPRFLAQWLGTDVVRNNFGQNAWVDLWKQRWHDQGQPRVVVADCRFDNEVEAIHKVGGIVIRLTRGAYTGKLHFHEEERMDAVHASERTAELRNIDYHVRNDGSIPDLYEELSRLFA